jgi:hypothetical protein
MPKCYKPLFFLSCIFTIALQAEICLCIVVNNDQAIIERTLESAKEAVDCICIYNQGCRDDSLVLIDSFKRDTGIPLLIAHPEEGDKSPKSGALRAARLLLKNMNCSLEKSYYLFLEPGDLLIHAESVRETAPSLVADSYSCLRMHPQLKVGKQQPILLKASLYWEAEETLFHEWKTVGQTSSEQLENIRVSQSDNFYTQETLDEMIHLCKERGETLFLAQAHIAKEEYAEAIALHEMLLEKHQKADELWFSYFMIGYCYEKLDNWEEALHWYLQTYQYNPSRADPLLKCATHYRMHADNELAYLFAKQGARIGTSHTHSLVPVPILEAYQFEEELSIAAYYTNYRTEGEAAANDLILRKNVPWSLKELTYRNLLFYVEKLPSLRTMAIDFELPLVVEGGDEHYHPMNPSIRKTKTGYQLICRSVNYLQMGAKIFSTNDPSGIFRTRNFLLEYDRYFHLQNEKEIIEKLPRKKIRSFNLEGLDDCRIFGLNDETWFSCNTGDTNPCGTFQISLCKLAKESQESLIHVEKLIPLKGPDPYRCEKNWLPYIHDGILSFIYSYEPFILYTPDLKSGACEKTLYYENKYDFSHFRGSAAPIAFDDGYLMLVHEVVLREDFSRCYLHRFLFLNKNLNITKLSKPFFFDHHGVEYCCSMTLDHSGKQLVVPIGLEDREAHLCFYDCNQIRSLLYPLKENSPHVFSH